MLFDQRTISTNPKHEVNVNASYLNTEATMEPHIKVVQQLEHLEKALQVLDESLHQLGNRLGPVLLEQVCSEDLKAPGMPPMCPVSNALYEYSSKIFTMERYVRYLIDSVQL